MAGLFIQQPYHLASYTLYGGLYILLTRLFLAPFSAMKRDSHDCKCPIPYDRLVSLLALKT
jgi:hypothetical protein